MIVVPLHAIVAPPLGELPMLSSIHEAILRFFTSTNRPEKPFDIAVDAEVTRSSVIETNKSNSETSSSQITSKFRVGTKHKKVVAKTEVDESSQKHADADIDEFATSNEKDKIKGQPSSIFLTLYRLVVYGGPLYYVVDLWAESATRKQKELQTLADQADAMKYGVGMTHKIAHLLIFLVLAVPLALADRGLIPHDLGIGIPVSFIGSIYLYIYIKKII